ncbi:MAG: TPM domain-containing protein [Crocinitomicaceae bacterium]|nr:TPM domain-containing protein [Crocinitomicaceae bacterium]
MKSKLFILLLGLQASFIFGQALSPDQLKEPKFNKTDFVVDPQNGISDEWIDNVHGSRATYFYPRYIEPVVVRLNDIRDPSDIDEFADRCVELWDLERKSEGRYVFQLLVLDQKDITYRFGSKIEPFYDKDSVEAIRQNIIDVHLFEGAEGTGSFVSISKLGGLIFEQVQYDPNRTGDDVSGLTSEYPDEILPSNGELLALGNTPSSNDELPMDDVIGVDRYWSGFLPSEIDDAFEGILDQTISRVEDVENIRELDNTNVNDPHKMLIPEAIDTLNGLITALEKKNGYQTAIVCLNSIGDNNPREFGNDLFEHWGIGQAGADNGLLILLVHDARRVEFITGRGTEIILTDALCYDIQQEEMVPYFKRDDYSTGMIRGMQAVYDALNGAPPEYAKDTYVDYSDDDDDYYYESTPFWKSDFMQVYLRITGALVGLWLIFLIIALFIKNHHKKYHTLKLWTLLIFPILFPVPFLLLLFVNKSLMNRWRNTIRVSKKTGVLMHKLSEEEEDEYLSKGQVSEEHVKSIDYDVWIADDKSDVLILAYKKWFSKYRKCPSCKAKTYWKVYDKTISSPTYTSTGTGERKHKCENCGHVSISTYTIPKLQRSSSSSSGSSSGGSWGGGSSYSGGSSYGGGSTGGGGSGSSW